MTESQGSVNGSTTPLTEQRTPNLRQKTFEVVSEQGSALSRTFQIADISRPLTSVGELADAGNVVVFGRKGGHVLNVNSRRRLDFKREHGVHLLRTWVQERAKLGFGRRFRSMRDTGPVERRTAKNSGPFSPIDEAQSAIVDD